LKLETKAEESEQIGVDGSKIKNSQSQEEMWMDSDGFEFFGDAEICNDILST
jgi:hypothetical protein